MASSPFDVNGTLGALLVGFAASCTVYGIFTSQTYTYFSRYPDDKASYKLLVAVLWFLETADQALIGHSSYHYCVTLFARPSLLLTEPASWTLVIQILLGALVGTIVKICFGIRVWRFSKQNIPVTGLIILLTMGQMGLATAFTVAAFGKTFSVLPDLQLLGSLSLGAGVFTDLFTAAALSFFLHKMRTGHRQSDSIVNGLTLYAVNTGILTSACSIVTLVTYNVNPSNFIFIAFYFVLSKLYAISFLATLNTRRIIRGRGTDREQSNSNTFMMVGPGSRVRSASAGPSPGVSGDKPSAYAPQLQIGIRQDVSVVSDVGQETMPEYHYNHMYKEPRAI